MKTVAEAKVDFDEDLKATYKITKGVHVTKSTGEVYAPVAMWLEALNLVLDRLKKNAPDSLKRIKGIGGSGQQHGSIFWNADAEKLLNGLDPEQPLVKQLAGALAREWSPNWQDQSTQKECDAFDAELGGRDELAKVTGSGAHHVRFPGFVIGNIC